MRGALHNGLALLMPRIKLRISALILGRPGRRDRHRQCNWKPLRCRAITVAGQLMLESDNLKLECGAAAKAEDQDR